MRRTAYHLTEVLRLLAKAERDRSTINLKAWTSDGETVDYTGWLVRGSSWRGGFHRLVNPANAEVRTFRTSTFTSSWAYSIFMT